MNTSNTHLSIRHLLR